MHVIGLFTLPDTDSDTNLDLDSKPDGYLVLYRNCSHRTDSDSDSDLDLDPCLVLYPFSGWISAPGSGTNSVSGNVNKPIGSMFHVGIQ